MITPSTLLAEFEARDEREAYARPLLEALERYGALWSYARRMNPSLGSDWMGDLVPDLSLARLLNARPSQP